jgi:hypothetical protein
MVMPAQAGPERAGPLLVTAPAVLAAYASPFQGRVPDSLWSQSSGLNISSNAQPAKLHVPVNVSEAIR